MQRRPVTEHEEHFEEDEEDLGATIVDNMSSSGSSQLKTKQ